MAPSSGQNCQLWRHLVAKIVDWWHHLVAKIVNWWRHLVAKLSTVAPSSGQKTVEMTPIVPLPKVCLGKITTCKHQQHHKSSFVAEITFPLRSWTKARSAKRQILSEKLKQMHCRFNFQ